MYYKYNKIMSYNLPIMAIIGAQGIGKTYGAKRHLIKKFINEGQKFIWTRDTEQASDKLCANNGEKFFEDIIYNKEFLKLDGHIKKEAIYINDKHAGYVLPQSTYYNYKGNAYQEIRNICHDEFIPEIYQRYNGDRALQFIKTLQFIGRTRNNYKVILLANAIDKSNDILSLFDIKISGHGFYFNMEKGFVLHYAANNPQFVEATINSINGKIIAGSVYEDTINKNTFDSDNAQFFDKKPRGCRFLCALHNANASIRLYFNDDIIYVCRDFNFEANTNLRFVNNFELVNTKRNFILPGLFDNLKLWYTNDKVRFENAACRRLYIDFISKTRAS